MNENNEQEDQAEDQQPNGTETTLNNKVVISRSTYKGHPMMCIKPVNAHPKDKGVRFGLRKAQLILEAEQAIRDFVAERMAEKGLTP